MKISDEFKKNSIFAEYANDLVIEDSELFIEIALMIFEQANIRIKEYPDSIQHLINRNYVLARSSIDRYDAFHSSVITLRRTLRSLLSGIIITSTISDENEIANYKKKWETYDENERSRHTFYFHHQVIYQQFKKVETLQELSKFNDFFYDYLVEMIFKLAGIIIRRMSYTIEYLINEDALNESCHQAAVHLELFREEVEKLKKKPL